MEGVSKFNRVSAADEHTAVGISQDETVLLFRSGGIYACATLSQITELIRLPNFTRVPLSAPWIVGLFNHRSDPVLAISMSRCLGLAEKDSPDGFLILTGERGHQISFWVDEVSDIITPDPNDWQAVPEHLSLPYCYGILTRRDRLYVGLRFDELLAALEGSQNGSKGKDAKLKLRSMVDAKAALQYYESTVTTTGDPTSASTDVDELTAAAAQQPFQPGDSSAQPPTPTPPPPPSKEQVNAFVASVMKSQDAIPPSAPTDATKEAGAAEETQTETEVSKTTATKATAAPFVVGVSLPSVPKPAASSTDGSKSDSAQDAIPPSAPTDATKEAGTAEETQTETEVGRTTATKATSAPFVVGVSLPSIPRPAASSTDGSKSDSAQDTESATPVTEPEQLSPPERETSEKRPGPAPFVVGVSLPSAPKPATPVTEPEQLSPPERETSGKIPGPAPFVVGVSLPTEHTAETESDSESTPEGSAPATLPPPTVASGKSPHLHKPMALGGMNFPMERYSALIEATQEHAPAITPTHEPVTTQESTGAEAGTGINAATDAEARPDANTDSQIADGESSGSPSSNTVPPSETWVVDAEEVEPSASSVETSETEIPDSAVNSASSMSTPTPTPTSTSTEEATHDDLDNAAGSSEPGDQVSLMGETAKDLSVVAAEESSVPAAASIPNLAPDLSDGSDSAEAEANSADLDSAPSRSNDQSPRTETWRVAAEEYESSATLIEASETSDTSDIETLVSASNSAQSATTPESAVPQSNEIQTNPSIQTTPNASPGRSTAARLGIVPAPRLSPASPRKDERVESDESDNDRRVTPSAVTAGVIMVLLLAFILWLSSGGDTTRGESTTGPSASGSQQATVTIPALPPTPVPEDGAQPEGQPQEATATIPVPPGTTSPEPAGPSEDESAAGSVGGPADSSAGPSAGPTAGPSDVASGGATPAPNSTGRTPKTITLPGGPPYVHHRVVRGDTLSKIARRYLYDMMRYPELAEENDIPNPDLIYPEDIIRVPVSPDSE